MLDPLETFKNFPFDREKLAASHKGKIFRTYLREQIVTDFCLKPVLVYLMKQYSANKTAKILTEILGFKIIAGGVIRWCKKLGIPSHSSSEAASLPDCRLQHENTNLTKYGAKNTFCKNTSTYLKKLETVKSRYGVDNIRKSQVFQDTRRNTMLKKYGVTSSVFLPTYERCTGRRSKLQKRVEDWLRNQNVNFEWEVPNMFEKFNDTLQRVYNPIVDILLREKKVVIEVYGDKWHANPTLYKAQDIIPRWDGEVTAEKIWTLDTCRTEQIKSFGYRVIVLWEKDIRFDEEQTKLSLLREIQNI